jgi:FAD/FMN-containing dehydrogenase
MNLEQLKRIVGENGWLGESDDLSAYVTEWRGSWHGATPLVLLPASTAEVSAILKHCHAERIAVVPQGGNTGLCGGAVPDESGQQVVVSLRRMNRIRSVSPDNFSLVAEAGCILANLQAAASQVGRLFPLSLAAEGSCQIGGNLSTNAGGVNVLRYGTAREQVLGLEVVLADGSVIDGLRELRKDTAGYDLKQLFIGAEGTLGIITAASLRLFPEVTGVGTALLAVDSAPQAVRLLAELRRSLGDQLQAFELISAPAMELVSRHIADTRNPLDDGPPWFVLLETASGDDGAMLEQELMRATGAGLLSDAVLAKSEAERQALWRIRHAVSEAQKHEGASLKHDVSVPVGAIGDFIDAASRAVSNYCPGARVIAFGHVGDGNVHFNVSQPPDWPAERFIALRADMADLVYREVAKFAGSFSAEHGVGVLKREALLRYRSPVEVELMRRLKAALDPHNIMNPGKVL